MRVRAGLIREATMAFGRKAKARPISLPERIEALSRAAELCHDRVDEQLVDRAAQVSRKADERMGLGGEYTVVALAGATGSGKSSLFNSLAGQQIAVPGVRRPTTREVLAAWWSPVEPTSLLDWLRIRVRMPLGAAHPELDGLVLLDLPDFDSTSPEHRIEVDRLLRMVDMFIWVVDPQKYADATLHNDYLVPMAGYGAVTTVVLNQADRLTSAELDATSQDLRRLLDAEGLSQASLVTTSALTGEGVDGLRRRIGRMVAEQQAAQQRLVADVAEAAAGLSAQVGPPAPARLPRELLDQLDEALADAAAVPVVSRAVLVASRRRGSLATGWPVVSWLGRMRPDPLKRLHLASPGRSLESKAGEAAPRSAHARSERRASRSNLVHSVGGVQQAQVSQAVRATSDAAAQGLPAGWARAVREAARSSVPHLADTLDRAVTGADLGMERGRRWWAVVRVIQWILFAGLVVGAGWLIANALLGGAFLPTPQWRGASVPVVLIVGSAVLGIAVAALSRLGVEIGARRRSAAANQTLTLAVARVTDAAVIAPVEAELDRYEQARRAVATARGER